MREKENSKKKRRYKKGRSAVRGDGLAEGERLGEVAEFERGEGHALPLHTNINK